MPVAIPNLALAWSTFLHRLATSPNPSLMLTMSVKDRWFFIVNVHDRYDIKDLFLGAPAIVIASAFPCPQAPTEYITIQFCQTNATGLYPLALLRQQIEKGELTI